MQCLNAYLRPTAGEQRLTVLDLLLIHWKRSTGKDSILNKYAIGSNKKSDFILQFNDN